MLVFRLDRYLRGGDHYSFNQQGFAAVRFTEFREDFHHQHQNVRAENGIEYGDLVKFVDFNYRCASLPSECGDSGVAGLGAGASEQCALAN